MEPSKDANLELVSAMLGAKGGDAMLFPSEFSPFPLVIGRTRFFSLLRFDRSRFPVANVFYVSFVSKRFFKNLIIYNIKPNTHF